MESYKASKIKHHFFSSKISNLLMFSVFFCVFSIFLVGNAFAASGIVVNAGGNRQVNQTQSIVLSASAYDVNSLPLTYSWSCTGGSLSSSLVLDPTYYAPPAVYDTSYSCTLTVHNNYGIVSSDTTNILVKGMSNGGAYVGNNLSVNLVASPSSGVAPLTGVSLAATVSGNTSGPIVYKFDCNNDGVWETMVQTSATSYTAYSACNYYTGGNYTARVSINNNGENAVRSINIYVSDSNNNIKKNNNLLSVDAGSNLDLQQGQTVTLNGSYFDSNYYNTTSYWSCTGGSLSTPYSLNPTYTAPNISADTTYICTLYATDDHGISNSDSISVTVSKTGSTFLNATTDDANASTNSATLNGTIVGDSGMGVAARFDWGTDATYGKITDWSYSNRAGEAVSSVISGLVEGKAYHYRIEIYNGSNTFKGKDMVFVTKPDSPINVSANALGSSQIKLSWVKGEDSCYSMVIRSKDGYPASTADGSVAYYGTSNAFIDKNLSSNTIYYYRVWAVGCGDGLYSFSDSTDSSTSATTYPAVSTSSVSAPASGNGSASQGTIVTQTPASGMVAEILARNVTQGESDWQNTINANPSDEIEFNIIITPSKNSDLENVVVNGNLSDKIGSVSDLKIGSNDYKGDIKNISVGTLSVGNSGVITFRAKIDDTGSFDFGGNDIINNFKVSADGVDPVEKNLTITVTKGAIAGASLIDIIGKNGMVYIVFSILIFLAMLTLVFYLIIDRRKIKRGCVPATAVASQPMDVENGQTNEQAAAVNKSKYFVIK